MRHRLLKLFSAFLVLVTGYCSPCSADDWQDPIDGVYAADGQWCLYLQVKPLDGYLTYKGSNLNPIAEVQVTYALRDPQTQQWGPTRPYENLWFHEGKALGCHRYVNPLPIQHGSAGLLIVRPSKDYLEETRALDDTIARLLLDVIGRQTMLNLLVFPREACERAAADFGSFGFYQAHFESSASQFLLVHMVSSPPGYNKFYELKTRDAGLQ